MELNSTNDAILIRNCALVQVKLLKLQKVSASSPDLKQLEKLIEYLTYPTIQLDKAKNLINSCTSPFFAEFANNIKSKSPSDLANQQIGIIEQMLHKKGNFPQREFNEFLNAFFKKNESLNANQNAKEGLHKFNNPLLISEPLSEIDKVLSELKSSNINATLFKELCSRYSSNVLAFSFEKFRQTFQEEFNWNLTSIGFGYNYDDYLRQMYSIKFHFENSLHNNIMTYQEPVTYTDNYFKGLCHAYLTSNKFAQKSVSSLKALSSPKISEITDSFNTDYKYITELSKCNINLRTKGESQIEKMFFSINTNHTPEKTNDTPIESISSDAIIKE